jgi:hypothetical protein
MDDINDIPTEVYQVASLGEQMEAMLGTEAFQTGVTLARARVFEEWTRASAPSTREELHAEMRALDRLLEAFKSIDDEGVVAREAIRQRESATGL